MQSVINICESRKAKTILGISLGGAGRKCALFHEVHYWTQAVLNREKFRWLKKNKTRILLHGKMLQLCGRLQYFISPAGMFVFVVMVGLLVFLLLGSFDCLFVSFCMGSTAMWALLHQQVSYNFKPWSVPWSVWDTHPHTHSHLSPGDCHSPPLCPGILYLCTCRLAAWKPGSAGHVAVAMSVEVHFSFLSSSFCAYFVPFNGREGDCRFPGLPKPQCKSLGFLASHCWITFGFVLGCRTSHWGFTSGLSLRARSVWSHSGEK